MEKQPFMTKGALVRIIVLITIFFIIEFLRLGYIRKDTAREYQNRDRFIDLEQRVEQLEERVTELENK